MELLEEESRGLLADHVVVPFEGTVRKVGERVLRQTARNQIPMASARLAAFLHAVGCEPCHQSLEARG